MNEIVTRLTSLRNSMKANGYDWYFCTSDDFHGSEYVADYFKVREHYTGFTGENAFLIVGSKKAYMWTDGRFFIQADIELKDTGVELMKMGEPGVPSYLSFIEANVKKGETILFDGRMVSFSLGKRIEDIVNKNGGSVAFENDIAGDLWENRPLKPSNPVSILGDDITGESFASKLSRIREKMKEFGADYHFLSSLDDIAWITNMRGKDVECNPVFLSYMLIGKENSVLFMQNSEVSTDVKKYLEKNNVNIADYDDILSYLSSFEFEGKVLLDETSVNYSCKKIISKKTETICKMNPSKPMKAIKNPVEIERLKDCYVKDSVCVTKFIYWLKNAVKSEEVTEISAADYLDNLRHSVPGFLDLSFPTISGYGSNGAIVHYSATKESNAKVKPEGMLLVDSGGQYLDGTTDVTRTISVGPVTDNMRLHYTKTAIGMLSLANARFLYGCTGRNFDILSRAPLWNLGIDFKHGTGHGIGYILNVHEGPQNIRWKYIDGFSEFPFEAGMLTSDEPGVYIEGEYGIRIENVILCVNDIENEYGKFLKFDNLTCVPLDRELLDKANMSSSELEMINEYQNSVYEKTKDFLTKEEAEWLYNITRPL